MLFLQVNTASGCKSYSFFFNLVGKILILVDNITADKQGRCRKIVKCDKVKGDHVNVTYSSHLKRFLVHNNVSHHCLPPFFLLNWKLQPRYLFSSIRSIYLLLGRLPRNEDIHLNCMNALFTLKAFVMSAVSVVVCSTTPWFRSSDRTVSSILHTQDMTSGAEPSHNCPSMFFTVLLYPLFYTNRTLD